MMKPEYHYIKCFLSFFLVVCLAILTNIACFAEAVQLSSDNYEYQISEDGTAIITKYIGEHYCITIPNNIDGYTVKSIGNDAFSSTKIYAVIIEDGIEAIGNKAFENCYSLVRIALPQSIKSIGESAFCNCLSLSGDTIINDEIYSDADLLQIEIDKQKKKTDDAQAQLDRWISNGKKTEEDISKQRSKVQKEQEKLTELETTLNDIEKPNELLFPAGTTLLPNGLEIIGDYAFKNCQELKSITIPNSVKQFGKAPFAVCGELTFLISPKHPTLAYNNGVLYNKTDKRLVLSNNGIKEFEIPQGILTIDDFAFYPGGVSSSSLQKITIPDSVTNIGECAFAFTQITQLSIPDSITSINYKAFYNSRLTSVSLGKNVKRIGDEAFAFTIIKEMEIPESVESIGEKAFPEGIVLIVMPGSFAEEYCQINSIEYKYSESDMDWL